MAQDTQTPRWTLGIDLGDRKSHYCWVDEAGAITDRGEVAMTVEALSELVSRAGSGSAWRSRSGGSRAGSPTSCTRLDTR